MNRGVMKGIVIVLSTICVGLGICFIFTNNDTKSSNSNSNSNIDSNSNVVSNSNIVSNSNVFSNSNIVSNSNIISNSNKKSNTVSVTGIKINTSKLTLEEGGSFRLTTIVLPNEATNKNVRWTSSKTSVATVDSNGLVSAKKEGTAKIKAITLDGNKSVTCTVTVTKKKVSTIVKLDDIKSIAKEYNSLTEDVVLNNLVDKYQDDEGNFINGMDVNKWLEALHELDDQTDARETKKIKLLDKLYDEKKTFIMLLKMNICAQDDYPLVDKTAKLLDKRNITYIKADMNDSDGIYESKIYKNNKNIQGKQVLIIKAGKVYANSDDSTSAFNSDSDVINWLSKYIDIK